MPIAGMVTDPDQLVTEDISYERGGTTISGYLAAPRRPGPRPGVVVIHEAFGLDGHVRDVVRRFAAAGFTALAPELYSRIGRPTLGDRVEMFAKMYALRDADVVADLEAAAAILRTRADANGRVGVVGFCFGGRSALLAACSTSAFDATVDCWGGFIRRATADDETTPQRPVNVIDLVPNLHGRLYAAVGADDLNPSPDDAAELRRRLAEAGKDAEVEVYEGAGHAFFNDRRDDFYRDEPAHRLWDKMTTFFSGALLP